MTCRQMGGALSNKTSCLLWPLPDLQTSTDVQNQLVPPAIHNLAHFVNGNSALTEKTEIRSLWFDILPGAKSPLTTTPGQVSFICLEIS